MPSYRRAIGRASKAAGVPHWHPHQLRHRAATTFRRLHGLEVARVLLGHADTKMTRHYAEADTDAAVRALAG